MSDMAVGASWRAPPSAFRAFPTALSPRLDVSRSHIRPDKSFQVALVESCSRVQHHQARCVHHTRSARATFQAKTSRYMRSDM